MATPRPRLQAIRLTDAAAERIIGHAWRKLPPVLPAALGYDAGLVGAAALARANA